MLGFDLETTGPNPSTARIVTAHVVECGPAGIGVDTGWLVNPGMPIPSEATAIHGITDDIAATGFPTNEAVPLIADALAAAWRRGLPVVAFNASFDLTVLWTEWARLGFDARSVGPVLDPRVIDLGCDRYRRGKRKLLDVAAHYGVKLGAAHDAKADALMACRIVWTQARRCREVSTLTLWQMQDWQRDAHRRWADRLTEVFARPGGTGEIVETDWPITVTPAAEAR